MESVDQIGEHAGTRGYRLTWSKPGQPAGSRAVGVIELSPEGGLAPCNPASLRVRTDSPSAHVMACSVATTNSNAGNWERPNAGLPLGAGVLQARDQWEDPGVAGIRVALKT